MAIQFDGSLYIRFPEWVVPAGADFSIDLPEFEVPNPLASEVIIQDSGNQYNGLRFGSNGTLQLRINNNVLLTNALTAGTVVTGTIARVSGTVTMTVAGESYSYANNDEFRITDVGTYPNGSFRYTGLMSGSLGLSVSGDDRSYTFNGSIGSTDFVDTLTTSGVNDGELFSANTGGYVASAASSIIINSFNANNVAKQRDSNGDAVFLIAGDITSPPETNGIEYSLDGGTTWALLDESASSSFSGSVTIRGQQTVLLRLTGDNSVTAETPMLTSGMGVLWWYQSNAKGLLTNNQPVTLNPDAPVPLMLKDGIIQTLADPTSDVSDGGGSTIPIVASYLANMGIPVIFHNIAVGGTRIEQWVRSAANYYTRTNELYDLLGGLEIAFGIGGENNSLGGNPSMPDYVENLSTMVDNLKEDYDVETYLSYFPSFASMYLPGRYNIDAAQDYVIRQNSNAKFGGDLRVIDVVGSTEDGDEIHLKTDEEAMAAGLIQFRAWESQQLAITTSTTSVTISGIPDGKSYCEFSNKVTGEVFSRRLVLFTDEVSEDVVLPVPVGTDYDGKVYSVSRSHFTGWEGSTE